MPKFLTIETKLAKEAEPILEELGIDFDTVIRMTLKRIVRDQNLSFLTAQPSEAVVTEIIHPSPSITEDRISKGRAISLFEAQGIRFNRNITFASKNRAAYNYWANPYFSALEKDLDII